MLLFSILKTQYSILLAAIERQRHCICKSDPAKLAQSRLDGKPFAPSIAYPLLGGGTGGTLCHLCIRLATKSAGGSTWMNRRMLTILTW